MEPHGTSWCHLGKWSACCHFLIIKWSDLLQPMGSIWIDLSLGLSHANGCWCNCWELSRKGRWVPKEWVCNITLPSKNCVLVIWFISRVCVCQGIVNGSHLPILRHELSVTQVPKHLPRHQSPFSEPGTEVVPWNEVNPWPFQPLIPLLHRVIPQEG